MQKNELTQVLDIIKDDYALYKNHINTQKIRAIKHAIKCVELMPELVAALETCHKAVRCISFDDNKRVLDAIKKAKELIK